MPIRPMTMEVLLNAFAGESMAHLRYLVFADMAEQEKFPNIARLFRAIAYAEYVHARNHYQNLRGYDGDFKAFAGTPAGPSNTSKNLELAIRGEEYEVAEMYPAYVQIALSQGERGAERSFKWALEAEKIHAQLYREAKDYVDRGQDWPLKGKIWICSVCGHTYVGEQTPEKCPVCGVPREKYVGF